MRDMTEPKIATKEPLVMELEGGKEYWWRKHGRSQKQPFCDGSHQGTKFAPMRFAPSNTMTARFCGCKYTKKTPFYDGSHLDL